MSVGSILSDLADAQRRLVRALQDEYFTDDVEPPPEAFGWDEAKLRAFMESGGELVDVSDVNPVAAPLPPSPLRLPGRPAIICIGDACVELASHALTAESVKHEKSPPLASETLVNCGPAAPITEQGPGWLGLLARDYTWRSTADVINRGASGYTTRMALADLPNTLATLPVACSEDVLAVILLFGAADASAEGAAYVAVDEFTRNLGALVAGVRAALPAAKLIVMTPPAIIDTRLQCKVSTFSLGQLKAYVAAVTEVVKAGGAGCSLVDLHTGMMTRLMQFNDALGPTGRHLSQKGNNFAYRMLKEHLADDLKIGPAQLRAHRPPAHAAAYPDGLDGDAKLPKGKRR